MRQYGGGAGTKRWLRFLELQLRVTRSRPALWSLGCQTLSNEISAVRHFQCYWPIEAVLTILYYCIYCTVLTCAEASGLWATAKSLPRHNSSQAAALPTETRARSCRPAGPQRPGRVIGERRNRPPARLRTGRCRRERDSARHLSVALQLPTTAPQ